MSKGRWSTDEDGVVKVEMASSPEQSGRNGEQANPSLKSVHSVEDWLEHHTISKHRRQSIAASLTKAVISGGHEPHQKTSGISLHREASFPSLGDDTVEIEDIIKSRKRQQAQKFNVRKSMSYLSLIWHDFKVSYRRWSLKNNETSIFKKQIKYMESNFGSAVGSLFVFMRWVVFLNFSLSVLWLGLVVFPVALYFPYPSISKQFAFKNLLDGKGMLSELWVFYGGYPSVLQGYHVALIYLVMLLVTYFGSLFLILGSVQQARSNHGSSHYKAARFKFCALMWTSWDHTITASEAATNLSKGIASALKDNLYEAKAKQDVKQRSGKEKCKLLALRLLAWLTTIILCGGGCVAIVYLVLFMSIEEIVPNTGTSEESNFINVYGTTVVFSLINSLVPVCIQQLPKIEHYASGRVELNVTLTRIFFLRMANLFALLVSLYNTVTKSVQGCAGTVIGQELYKLVIIDTLLSSVIQLCYKFGKYYWTQQKVEFNISSAVLVLVYRQALVWVGTIACPVMPLLGLLSSLVFLAVNYMVVAVTCKPPIKRWNQSRNTAFFSLFLLASLLILLPPVSVIIGSSDMVNLGFTDKKGQFCGPFGGDKPTRAYTKFGKVQTNWLREMLQTFVSEPFLIPIFLVLIAVLFHMNRAINSGKKQNLILETELQQEREEHEMLLRKLQTMGVYVHEHLH